MRDISMKMRWRLTQTDLVEREKDYTATFVMLNVDTDKQVTVALTQNRGDPGIDLVGACRALASAMQQAAESPDEVAVETTH